VQKKVILPRKEGGGGKEERKKHIFGIQPTHQFKVALAIAVFKDQITRALAGKPAYYIF
jgi:hypothetical protein